MPDDKHAKALATIETARQAVAKYGSPTGRREHITQNMDLLNPDAPIPYPIDYLDRLAMATPYSTAEYKAIGDELLRVAKENNVKVSTDPRRLREALGLPAYNTEPLDGDDLPVQRADLPMIVGGFSYGKNFRQRAMLEHIMAGGTLSVCLEIDEGSDRPVIGEQPKRWLDGQWCEGPQPDPQPPKFGRLMAASIVADVEPFVAWGMDYTTPGSEQTITIDSMWSPPRECTLALSRRTRPLDNDETRPLTIDSFGGDIGEQLRECIERPIRSVLDATIPGLRKGKQR